jgi:hypothetical protein
MTENVSTPLAVRVGAIDYPRFARLACRRHHHRFRDQRLPSRVGACSSPLD